MTDDLEEVEMPEDKDPAPPVDPADLPVETDIDPLDTVSIPRN